MSDLVFVRPKNQILLQLPEVEARRLMAAAEFVHLDLRENVIEPNKPITHVLFPETGVISLVTPMEQGSLVEIVTIGRDGFVGTPVLAGLESIPEWAFCQIEATGWRISVNDFRRSLASSKELSRLCHRYECALFSQIARSIGCNWTHSIEERCARWLLSTQDRVDGNQFYLTQEFLAMMLGITRSGVNLAAGVLQKAGLITYARGNITILDREGLERFACPCYKVISDFFQKTMQANIPTTNSSA